MPRTPPLWQRDFFLVNCFVLRSLLASERSGVVKTFRCATKSYEMDASNAPTAKQGQYLAFIYYYTKLNGQPPAESDMQRYFGTTAPTVHKMVVTLCGRGFISRVPGRGRTIRLLVGRDAFPDLE